MNEAEIQHNVQRCIGILRERGLRRTRALEVVIEELARRGKPATLAELASAPAVKIQCDPATVYRLVMKLEEQNLIRRLGFHERSSYFALMIPGQHHDYLICTQCGAIDEIDMACPVHALEEQLERQSGYRGLYHELEFFGVCPDCGQKA